MTDLFATMTVRLGADWMVYADDRILEYLEANKPSSPSELARKDELPFRREHINRRLRLLLAAELVQQYGQGTYDLAPRGRRYLAGHADLRDEPRPD